MHFPIANEVEAYWQGLRQGRTVPLRSEVDPRGIERALEFAFIAERIAPGIARLRLAGTHLNDIMGMEVRGMPVTAFLTPDARATLSPALEDLFQGPEILDLTLSGERGIGKPPLEARMLMLPLESDLGDVSRALGCLVTKGTIGRTPRRFTIQSLRLTSLQDGRVREAETNAAAASADGFAEDGADFGAPPRYAGKPKLRLVTDKD